MKLDYDLKEMTVGELRRLIMKMRQAVRRHRDADENARCWHNDLELYEKILPESKPAGKMTQSEKELLKNCKRYIRRQQCSLRGCSHSK